MSNQFVIFNSCLTGNLFDCIHSNSRPTQYTHGHRQPGPCYRRRGQCQWTCSYPPTRREQPELDQAEMEHLSTKVESGSRWRRSSNRVLPPRPENSRCAARHQMGLPSEGTSCKPRPGLDRPRGHIVMPTNAKQQEDRSRAQFHQPLDHQRMEMAFFAQRKTSKNMQPGYTMWLTK